LFVAGPDADRKSDPTTQPDESRGHSEYDRLFDDWKTAIGDVDPKSKEGFAIETKAFANVVKGLPTEEVRNVSRFMRLHNDTKQIIFDTLMGEYVLHRALDERDSDLCEEALIISFTENVDGKLLEWTLESKLGNSIPVLCKVYHNTPHDRQHVVVCAFQRAFPQNSQGSMSDDAYIDLCLKMYDHHRNEWRLNENYSLPMGVGEPLREKLPVPSSAPSLQEGLFLPK
jgi:hypothetical protein